MADQIREFEEQLREMRRNLVARMRGKVQEVRQDAMNSEHRPQNTVDCEIDGGETATPEIFGMMQQKLGEIDEALARIDAGRYGICDECEEEIAHKRLEAYPTATLCIECKARDERRTSRGTRQAPKLSFESVTASYDD